MRLAEDAGGRERGDEQKAENEFGKLAPEKSALIADVGGLAFGSPVQRVTEHDEADEGVAASLGEHGELAGGVRVQSAGGGNLGGVDDGEAGPQTIGMIAHVQRVTDQGKDEE